MHGLTRLLRWLSAAALLTILLLLAWTCIDIYIDANENHSGVEVTLSQAMYQAEDVHQRLQSLALPCAVLLGIEVILSIILVIISPAQTWQKQERFVGFYKPAPEKNWGRMQWGLMMTAIVFIVLGVLNGGLYDVFVKAINICTECIGLG